MPTLMPRAVAYATGVLVFNDIGGDCRNPGNAQARSIWIPFLLIRFVFAYTTIQNIHERPEGIKIAVVLHSRPLL